MPYFGVPIRNGLPIGLGTLTALAKAVAVVVPPVLSDPYFEYVSLLANTTTTNGAQNNTFLDGSTNAFSVTRNGNTTQGTFSPFSQTGWSNYFDGTGDQLTIPSSSAFAVGTVFTFECWIYPLTSGGVNGQPFFVNTTNFEFQVGYQSATAWGVAANNLAWRLTTTTMPTLNAWNHIVVTRSGLGTNQTSLFLNGVRVANGTVADGWTTAGAANIGLSGSGTYTGYISNLRLVKGTAVYDPTLTTLTVPTTPLTAISGTSLLTCQSNRFIDNSSNAFAITRNGDVSVQAFSPFNPTAAWSASTNGGSGYFDGTGDYLSAASDAAFALPAAFTFEVWLWPVVFNQTSLRGDTIFASIATSGLTVGRTDSGTGNRWGVAESNVAWRLTTTTLPTNAMWNHMVVVRDSSNNMALFLNGTRVANATVTTSFAQNAITIGSDNNQTGSYITGYMSGMRLVKGTAVYDPTLTTLTVPTAPLTAITNTSLLLNFTNAGIYDSASGNDLETVGNAQVSTVQSKWGTTSMAFDAAGDWLTVNDRPALRFGTAPFTVECWVYRNNATGTQTIVSKRNATPTGWILRILSTGNLYFVADPAVSIVSTLTIPTLTWTHVAVVREGTGTNQTKLYINGVNSGTDTVSNNFTQTDPLIVGADTGAGELLNGYIDDLRITNGYARYTANFTPPTAAFPLN